MPTLDTVDSWILDNMLDSEIWEKSQKQDLAVIQASRNLTRWYPETVLTDEMVAYQVIWELQGLDPVLKYQKQGIKAISEGSDRIDYVTRDKVAPEVREILGNPSYEIENNSNVEIVVLESGRLI
jgi:hypothetical protein